MSKKILYYQRRRLTVAVGISMCYISAWDIGAAAIAPLPAILQVVAVALLSMLFVFPIYFPILRRWPHLMARVEAAQFSLLPFAILALVAPTYDPISQGGALGIVALVASLALFQWAYCGPLLDRFTMRDLNVLSFTFNVNVTPEYAWRVLVPTPDHQTDYLLKGTRFMNCDDDDFNSWTVRLIGQPWAVHQINRLTMKENIPGSYFHFHFEPVNAKGAIAKLNGWFALSFAPNRDGTTAIQLELKLYNVPIRYRLFWYLGDAFHVYMRVMRSNVQGQIRRTLYAEAFTTTRTEADTRSIPA